MENLNITFRIQNTHPITAKTIVLFDKNQLSFPENIKVQGIGFNSKEDETVRVYKQIVDDLFILPGNGYIIKDVFRQIIEGKNSSILELNETLLIPNKKAVTFFTLINPFQFQCNVLKTRIAFPLYDGVLFKLSIPANTILIYQFNVAKKINDTAVNIEAAAAEYKNKFESDETETQMLIQDISDKVNHIIKHLGI